MTTDYSKYFDINNYYYIFICRDTDLYLSAKCCNNYVLDNLSDAYKNIDGVEWNSNIMKRVVFEFDISAKTTLQNISDMNFQSLELLLKACDKFKLAKLASRVSIMLKKYEDNQKEVEAKLVADGIVALMNLNRDKFIFKTPAPVFKKPISISKKRGPNKQKSR